MSYPKLAGGEYRFSCLVRANGPSFLSLWQISVTASYVTLVISALRLVLRKLAPRQVICLGVGFFGQMPEMKQFLFILLQTVSRHLFLTEETDLILIQTQQFP